MPTRFQPARGSAVMGVIARGPTGAAATIAVGSTTTGNEGTSASVSNSGSSSAAIFDFTVPRGATPAIGFNFDTSTTDADPGAGDVRFNHATPASVTSIYFDNVDRDGNTVTTWLDSFDDSTTTAKGTLTFTPSATPSAKLIYDVSGSVVDGTGYRKVTVTHVAGTVLPSSAAHLATVFSRTGDKGADGSGTFPGVSVDNEIPRFHLTGGSTLQQSGVLIDDSKNIVPETNDVGALGTSSLKWADLFLASGAVVNFNGGDVTITHSSNVLAFAGGSSGYTFDAVIAPASSDGAALGSTTLMWSDLFLASGAVINFNNGDVTVTHSANTLAFAGASSGYTFDAPVTAAGLTVSGAALKEAVVALSDGATPALDASLGNIFTLAAAGDRTIAVPSNPTSGQKIIIRHLASGGARTLALNNGAGGFRFGTDITALTQTASGKYDYIGCVYNAVDSKWDVVAYAKGY